MTPQWQRHARKRCYHCRIFQKWAWQSWHQSLSAPAVHWCHRGKLSRSDVAELTGVGHELKWAAEFPVAGSRASAHVEHVGSKGRQTFDVSVPWGSFYDSVASFVLVLRMTNKGETKRTRTGCWNIKLRRKKFHKQKLHLSWTPHLLVVLDLILQDDPVGSIWWLPGQWDSVSCDILRLDGSHWRGS